MSSAPTITFEVRPSRWLAALVGLVALAAMVAVLASRLSWPLRLAACVAVAVYAGWSVRKLLRQPLRAVSWHADDRCTLHLADGRQATGRLLGGRTLGPLVVLRLTWPQGGATALPLFPDSLDADTRRRLRMRLSAMSDNA